MQPYNRRHFLSRAGKFSVSAIAASIAAPAWGRNLEHALREAESISDADLATEEDFWYQVRQAFTVTPGLINLNNGGVSPAPKTVQDAMKRYYDMSNEAPSYYMWRVLDQGREPLRKKLAEMADCSPEEIAINRNSSEGLETIIFGLQLNRGDEVVAALQDYPNMVNAYKQRELRDGIKVKWINLDLPSDNDDYMVQQYVSAFTNRTKVVHLTHVINWNGQIIPVKKIAEEARKRNILVVVDGAHSFAHFDFSIPRLGADYFATSLHKWLYAPIGSGMLYVKKEHIASLYPLFASDNPLKNDIRKFEHLGTRPFFIEQAIGKAVEFHEMLGMRRKQERLHYLKNYWMEKVKDLPGVSLHTSTNPDYGCAIGMVSVKNRKPEDLDAYLFQKHKIHAVAINWENIHGVRITPNVYTQTRDLDILAEAIAGFIRA